MSDQSGRRISPTKPAGIAPGPFLDINTREAQRFWRENFNELSQRDHVGTLQAAVQHFVNFPKTEFPHKIVGQKLRITMAETVMASLEKRAPDQHILSTPTLVSQVMFACGLDQPDELDVWKRGFNALSDRVGYAEETKNYHLRDTLFSLLDNQMSRITQRDKLPNARQPSTSLLTPQSSLKGVTAANEEAALQDQPLAPSRDWRRDSRMARMALDRYGND